ncbi:NACHT, LRR and PYD domains-containing protein 12-like [Scomber japonicus]|uniref:NACHT, LRR and PYD domains-containing protein 12-like n=1 Tax=Scomber japonicus TaxID=13676 RepID=UPI00230514AA|nr:NACHT, LRR and PYD domains-containing protein 12-like [Scomber japonicus]
MLATEMEIQREHLKEDMAGLIETSLEPIQASIVNFHEMVNTLGRRVTAVETITSENFDALFKAEKAITELQALNATLVDRIDDHHTYSRIDYFFIDKKLLNSVEEVEYSAIVESDHAPILMDLHFQQIYSSHPQWRFNTTLLSDNTFCTFIELHLSLNNILSDSSEKLLSAVQESPNCKLKTLILTDFKLSDTDCEVVTSAVKSNPHLTELHLNLNKLSDSSEKLLSAVQESPNCKLKTLILTNCKLSETHCEVLASALKSNPHLTKLDLRGNELSDSSVKRLSAGLESPNCRLKSLILMDCWLSEISCDYPVSALKDNPSHLRELDLRLNNLKTSTGLYYYMLTC